MISIRNRSTGFRLFFGFGIFDFGSFCFGSWRESGRRPIPPARFSTPLPNSNLSNGRQVPTSPDTRPTCRCTFFSAPAKLKPVQWPTDADKSPSDRTCRARFSAPLPNSNLSNGGHRPTTADKSRVGVMTSSRKRESGRRPIPHARFSAPLPNSNVSNGGHRPTSPDTRPTSRRSSADKSRHPADLSCTFLSALPNSNLSNGGGSCAANARQSLRHTLLIKLADECASEIGDVQSRHAVQRRLVVEAPRLALHLEHRHLEHRGHEQRVVGRDVDVVPTVLCH